MEWTLTRALELLLRVCEVMAYAHGRGVIHRDLKPSNILVGPFGDVRVIDWGSAHVLDSARKTFEEAFVSLNQPSIETDRQEAITSDLHWPYSTASTGLPITILFMPPEILLDPANEPGPETDIYSMGVMLYELLARCLPYSRPGGLLPPEAELKKLIAAGPPAPVRSVNPAVSRDLAAICGKAMAYARDQRYRSMQELGADLRAVVEIQPVSARNPGPFLRFQKWAQRHIAHLLLGGAALLVASVAFFVVRGSMAERDVARQLTALRSADLAARSGQWRAALRHWSEAESAGYTDSIHLGLRRAEAWTVLTSPRRSKAELDKLARRSDLGDRRASVLLRVGEHELFDQPTFERGVHHVREALAGGLTGADLSFAKGLLADSTPEALALFRQVLQFDPYHHGAHRHSLGLEYLLGLHEELETHARVFRVLFPDDPTPGFLQAAELAAHQRLAEAETGLAKLRDATDPELHQRLKIGFAVLAATAKHFDVEAFLSGSQSAGALHDQLAEHITALPLAQGEPAASGRLSAARLPRLPCLQQYFEGLEALKALLLPGFTEPQPAIQKIKASWQRHPEAWLPALAAALLDNWHPRQGPKTWSLLISQAELFQMAADSASLIPTIGRWSRYQAASKQFELARSAHTNAAVARQDCLRNVRRIAEATDASAAECRAYFDLAFGLDDRELARALLSQWERRQPEDQTAVRRRIELEVATGAFGDAFAQLQRLLLSRPSDPWALEQKRAVLDRLKTLLNSAKPEAEPNPQPLNPK